MALRRWTANDQPSKPSAWVDTQVDGSITRDANGVVSAVAMQGAAGGTLSQPTAAQRPSYDPKAFGGALPGLVYSSSTVQKLYGGSSVADAQPFTLVLVFQTAATRRNYQIIFDTAADGNGNRAIFFGRRSDSSAGNFVAYAGSNSAIPNTTGASTKFVVVMEYNGSSSRAWINGVLTTGMNPGTFGALIGLAIGGGDSETAFSGAFAEAVLYTNIFTGDDFDRLAQGTAWKWGMQDVIPTGATYKNAAPMVDDGASSAISGTGASTLGSLSIAASAALLIAGAGATTLGGVGVAATGVAPIRAAAAGSIGTISASGAGSAIIQASAAAALQAVTSQATGQLPVTGSVTSQLGSISVAAAGVLPIRGAASATLDQIATSAAGELDVHGTAATTLGAVTVDARAGGVQSASGTAAVALGPVTAAAIGAPRIAGATGATLGPVQATGAGASKIAATMAGQLGIVTASAVATVPLRAAAAIALGAVAVASDARMPIRATASVTLQPIGLVASALSDGVPVITPPERIVRAPAQLRLVRAIARPRIVFARG